MSDSPTRGTSSDSGSPVGRELQEWEARHVWAVYSDGSGGGGPARTPLASVLEDLPAIAWEARRRVALFALIGIAFGALYLLKTDPIYIVKALVQIERRESALGSYELRRGSTEFLATQAEVMSSPAIVRAALQRLPRKPPLPPGPLAIALDRVRAWIPFGISGAELEPEEVALKKALAGLQTTPVLGTNVMAVTFRTIEPPRGVRFVEEVIDGFRVHVRGVERAGHEEAVALLEARERELGAELASLEEQYEIMLASGESLGEDENALSVQRARLEGHGRLLVEARARRIDLEDQLASLRPGSPGSPQDRALVELRASYRDRHPDVRQAADRAAVERTLQVAELEQQLLAAQRTEQRFLDIYQSEFEANKALAAHRVRERQMLRDIDRALAAHDSVVELLQKKQLELRDLASERAGTILRILEPAAEPEDALWPTPAPILLFCGLVGLAGGLGFAAVGEWSRRAREEWETEEETAGDARLPASPPLSRGEAARHRALRGAAPTRKSA